MSAELAGVDAIVLYFTMWCPVCDSHMSHMRTQVIPNYPNVRFLIIDFVSGTIEASRTAQEVNGYTDLTVLVDDAQYVTGLYNGNMGITVVIDNDGGQGTILMNEDYKDSVKLTETLDSLPL
jgi:C4-type Zn-finger protein